VHAQNWKLGIALSLTTALMWGLLPLALLPIIGAVDYVTITFYRLGGGGCLLFLWIFLSRRHKIKANFSRKNLPLILIAVLGFSGNYYFWLVGLETTSAATAQVMIQLAPMLLLVGSIWLFKENFNQRQMIGVSIFVVGLILFFNKKLLVLFNQLDSYSLGVIYLLVAAITWAIFGLIQKHLLRDFGALELIFTIVMLSCLLFLPFSSPEQALQLNGLELAFLIFGGLNTAVAYGCFTAAINYWETPRVSAVIAIVPVLTLLFGYLQQLFFPEILAPEPINQLSILGAIVVVVGSSIAALAKQKS
jgi:drug/metabolite transporter (DMT)-like permease